MANSSTYLSGNMLRQYRMLALKTEAIDWDYSEDLDVKSPQIYLLVTGAAASVKIGVLEVSYTFEF